MVEGKVEQRVAALAPEDPLVVHRLDPIGVEQRVRRVGEALAAEEALEADGGDGMQRVEEAELGAMDAQRTAHGDGAELEQPAQPVLGLLGERGPLAHEAAEDRGRGVDVHALVLEDLLHDAGVVVGVAVGEDHRVNVARRHAGGAQELGRVDRRVDEDAAPVHPHDEPGGLSGGVEAVRRAEHGDAERRRHERDCRQGRDLPAGVGGVLVTDGDGRAAVVQRPAALAAVDLDAAAQTRHARFVVEHELEHVVDADVALRIPLDATEPLRLAQENRRAPPAPPTDRSRAPGPSTRDRTAPRAAPCAAAAFRPRRTRR